MDDRSPDAAAPAWDHFAVTERFDLAGRVSLGLALDDEAARRHVHAQMDPFAAQAANGAGPADVILEALDERDAPGAAERQNPARDGLVTATHDGRLFVMGAGRACEIPDVLADGPARFAVQPASRSVRSGPTGSAPRCSSSCPPEVRSPCTRRP